MSFFRSDRALSHLLRHDPFSPFTRPSLSPFYSPFFTLLDEPRSRYVDYQPQPQQPSLTQGSNKSSSPSNKADVSSPHSSQSNSQGGSQMTRTGGDEAQVERRQRRHRQGQQSPSQHPLSVFGGSPFTGSAWPSLFNSALAPFAPLTASVQAIPDISVDLHSTPQSYNIQAAVPGVDKGDIKVTVEDGVLTIEAERKETRNTRPTNAASTAASTSSSASSSSNSSSTNTQGGAEMKAADESKEEKTAPAEEKSAASDSSTTSPNTSGATATTSNSSGDTAAMEEDGDDFHYTETFYGRVSRSITLPEDARVDDLTARYENGVLNIDIPRVQEQKQRGRRIEIQ